MNDTPRNFLPFTGWAGTSLVLLVWTVLTLVSDDNFLAIQRTLLLQFTLVE